MRHDDSATDDANRWLKLLDLVGTPRDGSHDTVTLYWDDATMTAFIKVGKKSYYISDRGDFNQVIDLIPFD